MKKVNSKLSVLNGNQLKTFPYFEISFLKIESATHNIFLLAALQTNPVSMMRFTLAHHSPSLSLNGMKEFNFMATVSGSSPTNHSKF
jgi:hypothetical protein